MENDVNMANDDYIRQQRAKEMGLPETATWSEINQASDAAIRQQRAQEKGFVNPDTSWSAINSATPTTINMANDDYIRQQCAKEMGLPETATWSEINQARDADTNISRTR